MNRPFLREFSELTVDPPKNVHNVPFLVLWSRVFLFGKIVGVKAQCIAVQTTKSFRLTPPNMPLTDRKTKLGDSVFFTLWV